MHSLSNNDAGYLNTRQSFFSLPGLLVVLVLHGALFYFLMSQKLIPPPENMVTLFAEIVKPPPPKEPPKIKTQPKPKPVKLQPVKKPKPPKPKKRRIVSKAPVKTKQEYVAPPPPPPPEPEPAPEPAPAEPQMPAGPVMLSSELSVSCPQLAAPVYPSISRRMGEEGKLVLRVELDEKGRVDKARVVTSSGYSRLDNAALETVRKWRCNPSTREGQAVRAVALQPFNFVLQGN